MKCPYLKGTYLLSCKVTKEVYVPSRFEFEEYCNHNRHKICPLYLKSANVWGAAAPSLEEGVFSHAR